MKPAYITCRCGEILEVPASEAAQPHECPACHATVLPPVDEPPFLPEPEPPKPVQAVKGTHICAACGRVSTPWAQGRGSWLVGIVLLFFFIVPALIYAAWCASTQRLVCRFCKSPDVVELRSPRGQKLLREFSA